MTGECQPVPASVRFSLLPVRFNSLKSEGSVVAADQFFLSHVHCDHLVSNPTLHPPDNLPHTSPHTFQIGLDVLALFCKKKSYGSRINNKLYCSQISKKFVLKKYPLFPEKVKFPLKVRLLDDRTFKGNCSTDSQ